VHQLEVHPYVLSHIQPILDIASKNGIHTSAFGVLAPLSSHPTGGPAKPVLEKIAARLSNETGQEVDASQALLLWFRTKGITAITGSHNAERMKHQAAVQGLPGLTEAEVKEVDEAGKKGEYMRSGSWRGQRGEAPPLTSK
jgi:diketogulonate reductase-like aldo/keto reductase